MHRYSAAAAIALLAWAAVAATAAERLPRYSVLLENGQRIQGDKLADWHDKNAMPRLEGQPLLEPGRAFRWLRDRSLRPAELPTAYVEMHGGDRLPGAVVEFRSGNEQPFLPLLPLLIVATTQTFQPPDNRPFSEVRVSLAGVRRIVWQRRGRQPYQPGTMIYRDGRSLAFRAVRFHAGQVHVLLAEGGDRRIPWSDLAELHLPEQDAWSAWFDELAQLCPDLKTRLYQLETTAGLVATASLARLAPRFEGNSADPDRWVHGIQPAWSLDILWVPCREMVFRRSWLPHEAPLSRLPAQPLAGEDQNSHAAQIDRSIQGTALASQTREFGWGIGVHGKCELAFALPPGASSLRTHVCLDRSVGNGGCILARIFANEAAGTPLWQSATLVGSDAVAESGELKLAGPAAGQQRLVLAIDPVLQGRPAGADPLEIRDSANWCDPLLSLDPAVVQSELDRRLANRFAAWKDWSARGLGGAFGGAEYEIAYQRDERRPEPGSFQPAIRVKSRALVLARKLAIGPRDNWLVIATTRPPGPGQQPKLEVRIGGEPVAEFPVPERQHDADENRPLAIPLAAYQRTPPATVEIEIRQFGIPDSAAVEYRTIELVEQLPTLYQIFEEQLPAAVATQEGQVPLLADDDRHHGARSLRVLPGAEQRLALPATIRIRERPAWGEYRFLRFAVRKPGGGRASLGFETLGPGQQLPRYDLGRGDPAYESAKRVWQDLPKEWVVITRDLYADFGSLDLHAMLLGCPDGEGASFDHIYLARGHHDLDRIPAAPSAEATNEKARQELTRPLVQRARPAVVKIEFKDGRLAAGVFISPQGEILTAGHAVIGSGRPARVQLADGTVLSAKTLGVAREFDLGMLRIEPPGNFPKLDPDAQGELPQNQAFVAISYTAETAEFEPPASAVVSLRRVFRSTVWTDLDASDWLAGGPLLNRDGRLVGIQSRPSRFGGVLYSRFQDAWPQFPRIRNGEVFGAWQPGVEPASGLVGSGDPAGYKLSEATGAAAQADLRASDVIVRIGGQPVVGPDDVQLALSERDAGQEVVIDFLREGVAMQAKLTLTPRLP